MFVHTLYDNGKEGFYMRTVLKILLFPVVMFIDLFVWICCGLLSCSAFVFSLASSIVSILAVAVLLTCSMQNGLILLVIAFLVSPIGLPLLAAKMVGSLQYITGAIRSL